ncbi:hypothetical protein [Paraburkholderia sp. UCT2]|nr:hypothetical protein [Paraburkholderia sp. UCT2]
MPIIAITGYSQAGRRANVSRDPTCKIGRVVSDLRRTKSKGAATIATPPP